MSSYWNAIKNVGQKIKVAVTTQIMEPPEKDQFQINGQLSPNQFQKAGDKLIQNCKGWQWKPSSNPKYKSKYLNQKKQYLINTTAICKKRVSYITSGKQQCVKTQDGDQIVILHAPQNAQEQEQKQQNTRYYTMYIVYDQYHFTPRMFFSAKDYQLNPISNQAITQDIQKEYLYNTLTMEQFLFQQGVVYPTVHPCKHADVLKKMADSMRENGQQVGSHMALFIFLKFITCVIPTVQFDLTGGLHFQ